jgi:hypothetical protein
MLGLFSSMELASAILWPIAPARGCPDSSLGVSGAGTNMGALWDIPASISGGRGSGANPNLLNQFLSNGITEGRAIVSHNAEWNAGSGGYACFMNGTYFAVTDITHWLPDGTGNCFAGKAPSVQFPINSFQVFVATACGLMEVSSLSIWLRTFCWKTIISQIRTSQCQSIALAGECTAGSTIEQQL